MTLSGWAPDFLVIGAYKSGTTTLHHALRAHPGLFVPERKEPGFFAFEGAEDDLHPAARTSVRDEASYRAMFRGAPPGLPAGEVSPAYLTVPGACERIAQRAPDAHLVAVLRNPIERAYSDYLMYVRDGLERKGFLEALDEQEERARRNLPTGHYVSTGLYARQLEPYLHRFSSDQLLLLLFDDLAQDLSGTLRRVFRFLGVDEDVEVPPETAHNVSGVPRGRVGRTVMSARHRVGPVLRPVLPERARLAIDRSLQRRLDRPPMPEEARERLQELFRPEIERLEAMLGRSLATWLA